MHQTPGQPASAFALALALMMFCASCVTEAPPPPPPPVPPLVVQRIDAGMSRKEVFAKLNGDAQLNHKWHHRDARLWDWQEVELPDGHLDLFFQVKLKEDKDHPLERFRSTTAYPQYCEHPLSKCQDGCHVCGPSGQCRPGSRCEHACGADPYHLCLPTGPSSNGVERDYVVFSPDRVPRRDEDVLIRYQFTNHVGWVMRYGDWPEDGLGVCYYDPSHK